MNDLTLDDFKERILIDKIREIINDTCHFDFEIQVFIQTLCIGLTLNDLNSTFVKGSLRFLWIHYLENKNEYKRILRSL